MDKPSEFIINIMVKQLPEGQYLATSEDLPGLLAQGRTVSETLEIAHDVARKLIESFVENGDQLPKNLERIKDLMQFKLAVGY